MILVNGLVLQALKFIRSLVCVLNRSCHPNTYTDGHGQGIWQNCAFAYVY